MDDERALLWTAQLADHADELLVADSSPEMLDLNRSRVGRRGHVTYRVSDASALRASHAFDVVFSGSSVPRPSGSFRGVLERPGGPSRAGERVFLVDEADHGLWDAVWTRRPAPCVGR